jgi:hypothetical protein
MTELERLLDYRFSEEHCGMQSLGHGVVDASFDWVSLNLTLLCQVGRRLGSPNFRWAFCLGIPNASATSRHAAPASRAASTQSHS